MGRSISPRRQAVSQGCAHTRPQMLARGWDRGQTCRLLRIGPSAISATYRPALVWAGQAIMQGKLVFNQSLSTFLSLYRLSMMAARVHSSLPVSLLTDWRTRKERTALSRSLSLYLLSVKSALLSPATVHRLGLVLGALVPRRYACSCRRARFRSCSSPICRSERSRESAIRRCSRTSPDAHCTAAAPRRDCRT